MTSFTKKLKWMRVKTIIIDEVSMFSPELFEKLEILLNDNTMSKKMGNTGRDFISNNFSWEIISQNFKEKIEKHLDLS